MKWWRYIYDERLPRGCRLFPTCLSCGAYCYGKKLHEKEVLGYNRGEETKKIIKKNKEYNKGVKQMTREERQLLFVDLCARLPYGVKVKYLYWDEDKGCEYPVPMILDDINSDGYIRFHGDITEVEGRGYILTYLPYLRPMSSMTEEEKEEFRKLSDEVVGSYGPYHREFTAHCVRLGIKPGNPHECIDEYVDMGAIDWLNAHHFDYRGLIEKGLALEAPEGMYKED